MFKLGFLGAFTTLGSTYSITGLLYATNNLRTAEKIVIKFDAGEWVVLKCVTV
jgi:hypothetical protein